MYVTIDFVESIPIQPVAYVKNVQLLRKNIQPSSDLEVEPQNEPQVNFQCTAVDAVFPNLKPPLRFFPRHGLENLNPQRARSGVRFPVLLLLPFSAPLAVLPFCLGPVRQPSPVELELGSKTAVLHWGMILKGQEEDVTKKRAMQKLCI